MDNLQPLHVLLLIRLKACFFQHLVFQLNHSLQLAFFTRLLVAVFIASFPSPPFPPLHNKKDLVILSNSNSSRVSKSKIVVPIGTSKIISSPFAPDRLLIPPGIPSFATKFLIPAYLFKLERFLFTRVRIFPPFPPLPPLGPPRPGKKEVLPFPPLPLSILNVTSSTNIGIYLFI